MAQQTATMQRLGVEDGFLMVDGTTIHQVRADEQGGKILLTNQQGDTVTVTYGELRTWAPFLLGLIGGNNPGNAFPGSG